MAQLDPLPEAGYDVIETRILDSCGNVTAVIRQPIRKPFNPFLNKSSFPPKNSQLEQERTLIIGDL